MRNTQSGFTLIELVVVIVILGILAATALPRFVGLQGDARLAKAQAVLGSVRSASALAHAAALARGVTTGTVDMEGSPIDMINGYPTANATGIVAAAQLVGSDGLTMSAGGALATSSITIDSTTPGTPANCRITYAAATAANTAPTISTNADLAGCT